MRCGSAKTTPGFDCNACDLYGKLQSQKKLFEYPLQFFFKLITLLQLRWFWWNLVIMLSIPCHFFQKKKIKTKNSNHRHYSQNRGLFLSGHFSSTVGPNSTNFFWKKWQKMDNINAKFQLNRLNFGWVIQKTNCSGTLLAPCTFFFLKQWQILLRFYLLCSQILQIDGTYSSLQKNCVEKKN